MAEIEEALKSFNEDGHEKAFVTGSFWKPCGGTSNDSFGGCALNTPTSNPSIRSVETKFA
jgi:hypothetical protein